MRLIIRLLTLSFLFIILRVLTIEVQPTVAHPQQLGGCHSYIANEAQCASGCSWVPGNPFENGAGTQQLQFFEVTCNEAQGEIPACQASIARNVPNVTCCDQDNDGSANPLCGGSDCNDNNAAIKPGATENCWDGIDNNCDGKVDFQDTCGCPVSEQDEWMPGGGWDCTLCNDGIDNDCDNDTDSADSGCNPQLCASPVLIDVAGNGFDLSNAANGINFDLNSDGTKEKLSWTVAQTDDAWLALDRNGDGVINNGTELFGNFTPQPNPPMGVGRNGFNALADYDQPAKGGNGDGLISAQDSVFGSLWLWQDKNHNGVSETNELRTLNELGLIAIECDYRESKRRDRYGNAFRYRAKVIDTRNTHVNRWAWDVFLVRDRSPLANYVFHPDDPIATGSLFGWLGK